MSTKTPKLTAITRTIPAGRGVATRWKRLLAGWGDLPVSSLLAALLVVALVAYVVAVVPAAVTGFILGFGFVVALLVVAPLVVLWLVA
jgi:hypothetical protein